MRHTTNLCTVLLASAAALTGCKKKESEKPAEATKTAPAPAPAPAPPPGVVIKDGAYKQIEGTYDATKAIALHDRNTARIVIPHDCGPDFGCGVATQWANGVDDQKLVAACPKGVVLTVFIKDVAGEDDPKPGKHAVDLQTDEVGPGSYTSIHSGDLLEVTERTADSISGKLTYSEDQVAVNGTFKATLCQPQK